MANLMLIYVLKSRKSCHLYPHNSHELGMLGIITRTYNIVYLVTSYVSSANCTLGGVLVKSPKVPTFRSLFRIFVIRVPGTVSGYCTLSIKYWFVICRAVARIFDWRGSTCEHHSSVAQSTTELWLWSVSEVRANRAAGEGRPPGVQPPEKKIRKFYFLECIFTIEFTFYSCF